MFDYQLNFEKCIICFISFQYIKVEIHYLARWEVVAVMPTYMVVKNNEITKQKQFLENVKNEKIDYNLGEDSFIECSVEASFVLERLAMGNVTVRWFAKKIDYHTPMYNDTVSYREVKNMKESLKSAIAKKFQFCNS